MSNRSRGSRFSRRMAGVAFAACAALASIAAAAPAARAGDAPGESKIQRQIGVMDKIIDKVLLDSPNFLVHSGENTRGLYLPEVGALFTFDAALTDGGFDVRSFVKSLGNRVETKTDEEGNTVIVIKKGKSSEGEDEGDGEETAGPGPTLDRGRDELVQTLLDYGETLTALRDDQSIVIAAFVQGMDLPHEKGVSQVVLRARMGDIRAYSDGKLSEADMRQRIKIDES
jgi:hypothetical protein